MGAPLLGLPKSVYYSHETSSYSNLRDLNFIFLLVSPNWCFLSAFAFVCLFVCLFFFLICFIKPLQFRFKFMA